MNWTRKTALAVVPLLMVAGPVRAQCGTCVSGGGCPASVDWNCHFRIKIGGCGCCAGPWYSYWPYEAHFQAPAPVGCYPYWPSAAAVAAAPVAPAVPAPAPAPGTPAPPPPSPVQPTSYQAAGYYQPPAYWYGR